MKSVGVRRIANALMLIIAAIGLVWAIVTTTGRLAFERLPGYGALIRADDPDPIFRRAGEQLLRSRGRVDEPTLAAAVGAANRRPLAAEPFVFAGMRALESGDSVLAERALLEARRRNPRHRLGRLMLIGVFLSQRQIAEGSNEIAAVVRLVPRAADVLVPELVRLARDPGTSGAVVQAIGADPLMESVIERLAGDGADPDLLMRLAARQPRRGAENLPHWQEILIARLVQRGEVARARDLWFRFVGSGDRQSLIYDASFAGAPGPPPFNWALTTNVGVAERAQGPALEVQYFGRVSGPLATQLLMLRPGRHRLAFEAEGSADGQGSRLVWHIACREGRALLDVPIREVNYTPRDFTADFSVPAEDCEAQWLQLVGVAAEFPSTQSARFTGLNLQRVGNAE